MRSNVSDPGNTDPDDTELADLDALLADPNLWDEPIPEIEDFLVQAITAEAATVVPISLRSRMVRSVPPFVAGIAAALLLVASIQLLKPQAEGVKLALIGTDLAPRASADALIDNGPLGVQIKLDISGLPPSPEGTYYEAWVRKGPEVGVSAGTFHLRGGDGEIELWAGVSTDEYPLITVTLQQKSQGAASSGKVVLKGRLDDQ